MTKGNHGSKVSVEGVIYNNFKEAVKHMGIPYHKLVNFLNRTGSGELDGFIVERIGDKVERQRKQTEVSVKNTSTTKVDYRKPCGVRCITTNRRYPSISAAARTAGVPMWTMSVKMEKAGKFIDKKGREYVRETPMLQRTDRNYGNTSPNISKEVHRRCKAVAPAVNFAPVARVEEAPAIVTKPVVPTALSKDTLVKVAKIFFDSEDYAAAAEICSALNTKK